MCKVRGVRTYCACKDRRCKNRRDFIDWSPVVAGVAMTSLGHGWQYYVDEIDELCSQGEFLIASGIMFWADEHKKKVVTVVAHVGLDVTWENRYVNPEGKGILCKHCEDGGHSVAG